LDVHHDYAPVHKALSVKKLPAQKSITEINTRPIPLIWLKNEFLLFPKMKSALKMDESLGY
jgi:hypothetical protein